AGHRPLAQRGLGLPHLLRDRQGAAGAPERELTCRGPRGCWSAEAVSHGMALGTSARRPRISAVAPSTLLPGVPVPQKSAAYADLPPLTPLQIRPRAFRVLPCMVPQTFFG